MIANMKTQQTFKLLQDGYESYKAQGESTPSNKDKDEPMADEEKKEEAAVELTPQQKGQAVFEKYRSLLDADKREA